MNETLLTDAIVRARGDIFIAAAYAGCTVRQMDSYIRRSEVLRIVFDATRQIDARPGYEKIAQEDFEAEIQHLLAGYRLDAVNEVHSLATIPISEHAEMMNVKLKAATTLMQAGGAAGARNESAQVFSELRQLYEQQAPRIKAVKVAQIEFES